MDRRFIVRPLAEADLEQAANWYDEEQAGLGSRFPGWKGTFIITVFRTPR